MCYQVCAIVVVECLPLTKRNFKHTLQWVSLKTFSLIFHFTSLALSFSSLFSRLDAAYGNSLYVYSYFFLNYQRYILRQYNQKTKNVFTCYGILKRTKERTNIENNEKILSVFIITIVLCIVCMSLSLIADVSSTLLFIW